MRKEYKRIQCTLESSVFEIPYNLPYSSSQCHEFAVLPSEFPRLDGFDAEYFYIINLDDEVLTMNHSIHWRLSDIPRDGDLWLRAIADSVYFGKPTISLDLCPREHMASVAIELPERDMHISYPFRTVNPRTAMRGTHQTFLVSTLAKVFVEYHQEIIRFGREWSPKSFSIRELTFALISIASGKTRFYSFPARDCNARTCSSWSCNSDHMQRPPGWLGMDWVGDKAPLLEFGSMSHMPNERPGTSPHADIYWFDDVLVSLVLVVDGKSITRAVTWGLDQGRENFQIVVLSIFQVAFAEVSGRENDIPSVAVTKAINLSPIRAEYCTSTHPCYRPELKPGMQVRHQYGERILQSNCTGTRRRLREQFPGLAALVNFLEVAADRRAINKSVGTFPQELYCRILDFADYDTWKTCLRVSKELRSECLKKYRLDDSTRIVGGPFVRLSRNRRDRLLSFEFQDMQHGETLEVTEDRTRYQTYKHNWTPLIGEDQGRTALMLDINMQFEPADEMPLQTDSEEDCL